MPGEGFEIGSAYIKVRPDLDDFAEELEAGVEEAAAGAEAKVKIGADDAELKSAVADARAKLDELDGKRAEATLGLDKGGFDAGADDARAKLDDLDGKKASPELGLDKADFDAKRDEAKAGLDEMDAKTASPKLLLNDSGFRSRLAADKADLAAAGSESGGGMLGAITMGVGSLLPGLGGAAAGLGLLGATGGLAFGGIAKALSAAHQASQNVGTTGAQLAAQQFASSVQVAQAQQSLAQARQQAAQNAVTSAYSIEQAEMGVASVTRSSAAAQIQALEQVGQARQGVQQAEYGLQEANYQLGQSYEQVREQIRSLDDQLADSKLNVKSAQLAIAQAIRNQQQVDSNAYSTALDRQQAALAVAQAQQQLKDAQDQETASQYAATQANKAGVDGSQQVIQAKEQQLQATEALKNAQQAYADAQRNLRDTEFNDAQQEKQAQLQLKMAREQAAYQQQQDAQAIRAAEQNVTDTIREQQLQMAATASESNSAASQFAKDMAALSPPARRFVDQVLSMRGAFHSLETAAQNAVLPGFTVFLKGVSSMIPAVRSGITQMGTAMGKAFAGFGKEMATPGAQKVLQGLISNGIQFASIVLPAFSRFFGELAQIGSQSGAASGLAAVLAGIANGLTGLAASVGRYEGPINQFLKAVGAIIAQIGPPLGQIIGLVAKALGPLTSYLDRHPNGTVVKVIGDIVAGLIAFKGLQKLLPDFITGPLSKFAGKGGEMVMKPFRDAAGKIPGLMGKAWTGVSQGFLKTFGDGGLVARGWGKLFGESGVITTTWSKVFGAGGLVASGWSNATTWASSFASNVGSQMSTAATSVVSFFTTLGSRLAAGAVATGTWIAANTAAAAAYVAENLTMAASATAAFVAENAATLGLAAAVAALVGAIVYVATHWKQSWDAIRDVSLFVWHDVLDPMWQGISQGAMFLWHNAIEPAFNGIKTGFGEVETAALWLWHNVFDPVWQGIETGASRFVTGFGVVWDKLKTVFKTPVNFLINTVYMGGIRRFWDDVVNAIGLNSLDLPAVKPLAGGGMLPGYAPGRDSVPALLSPGEAVLTPGAARAIGGAPVVNALNAAYAPAGGSGGPGRYAGGGIVNSALTGVSGVAKALAALVTGNTTAFTNAMSPLIGTDAAGNLGKVMIAIPKTLIGDLAKHLFAMTAHGLGAAASAVGGLVTSGELNPAIQAWFTTAARLTGAPSSWITPLELIAKHESDFNPRAVNNTPAGIAAGTPEGVMQTVLGTFERYHEPGTSLDIFDPVANIAAAIRYIRAVYGNPLNTPGLEALAKGQPYTGYDSGGWLPPGMTLAVNQTGRPEPVLNPQQWQAVQASAAQPKQVLVNVNFYGTQVPGPEQMAEINRQLALAVSGA